MQNHPFVSIIILNFNGKKWFKECFESLRKLDYPADRYEVILGDNASTDGSAEEVRKNYPGIKVVSFDQNYGFCKSNNECAKQARGDYLVFLNNDTFVSPQWLTCLVEGALSEPGIVSCASKILFPQLGSRNILNAAGGVILPSGAGMYDGWLEEDGPSYQIKKYTAFGCGAGVLVEKKFFIETGGFDEYYFYSVEESDLGFRAWAHGSKVLYVPSAVMWHYMGQTGFRGKGITPDIEFLITRNTFYFLLKNFGLSFLLKGLFYFCLRLFSKTAYCLLHLNIQVPFAIAKACFFIFRDLQKILKKRKTAQKSRKVSDQELRRKGIIVSNWEAYRRSLRALKNSEKYFEGVYDRKNNVSIETNDQNEFVFRKTGTKDTGI